MRRAIPPLNPLHVFEVAARLGNFTRAAQELNVTQSTVSRQIAVLEGWLNVELFHRTKLGVSLSPAGEAYRRGIAPAFAAISDATDALREGQRRRALAVRVYPTFAVKWLIPRLAAFSSRWPELSIELRTGTTPVDFLRDDVDFSIELVSDRAVVETSRTLLRDLLQPVCSPSYRQNHPDLHIETLSSGRILHSRYRRNDWQDWLAAKGLVGLRDEIQKGSEFPSSLLTYEAAIQGLGIAMGQVRLLEEDIAKGRLVALFPPALERAMSYRVVWSGHRSLDAGMRTFLNWIVREARKAPEASDVHI